MLILLCSYPNEIAQYTAIDVRNAAFKASVCESNRLIRGQGKMAASPFTSYHYPYVDRREAGIHHTDDTCPTAFPDSLCSRRSGEMARHCSILEGSVGFGE
jgi:hypothetical protein